MSANSLGGYASGIDPIATLVVDKFLRRYGQKNYQAYTTSTSSTGVAQNYTIPLARFITEVMLLSQQGYSDIKLTGLVLNGRVKSFDDLISGAQQRKRPSQQVQSQTAPEPTLLRRESPQIEAVNTEAKAPPSKEKLELVQTKKLPSAPVEEATTSPVATHKEASTPVAAREEASTPAPTVETSAAISATPSAETTPEEDEPSDEDFAGLKEALEDVVKVAVKAAQAAAEAHPLKPIQIKTREEKHNESHTDAALLAQQGGTTAAQQKRAEKALPEIAFVSKDVRAERQLQEKRAKEEAHRKENNQEIRAEEDEAAVKREHEIIKHETEQGEIKQNERKAKEI